MSESLTPEYQKRAIGAVPSSAASGGSPPAVIPPVLGGLAAWLRSRFLRPTPAARAVASSPRSTGSSGTPLSTVNSSYQPTSGGTGAGPQGTGQGATPLGHIPGLDTIIPSAPKVVPVDYSAMPYSPGPGEVSPNAVAATAPEPLNRGGSHGR